MGCTCTKPVQDDAPVAPPAEAAAPAPAPAAAADRARRYSVCHVLRVRRFVRSWAARHRKAARAASARPARRAARQEPAIEPDAEQEEPPPHGGDWSVL